MTRIYFFLDCSDDLLQKISLCKNAEDFWFSHVKNCRKSKEDYPILDSDAAWIVQTYLRIRTKVKKIGLTCELINRIPSEGILIITRGALNRIKPDKFYPNLFLICIKNDLTTYPFANLNIVQNREDSKYSKDRYYIPLWTQPGLIKRDLSRGSIIKNAYFFGETAREISQELKEKLFVNELKNLGVEFTAAGRSKWHDYSDADVVIGVRNLNSKSRYLNKPSSKLFNSWRAGVPAILGTESAYQSERKSELDYIEIKCAADIIKSLKRLKENPILYKKMIDNCRKRAKECTENAIIKKWLELLVKKAIPEYNKWKNASNFAKKIFFLRKIIRLKTDSIRYRMLCIVGEERADWR